MQFWTQKARACEPGEGRGQKSNRGIQKVFVGDDITCMRVHDAMMCIFPSSQIVMIIIANVYAALLMCQMLSEELTYILSF